MLIIYLLNYLGEKEEKSKRLIEVCDRTVFPGRRGIHSLSVLNMNSKQWKEVRRIQSEPAELTVSEAKLL